MRRWIVLAVAALVALAPDAAAAQPAPPDPVQALKRQFRAEHGVTFTEVSRMTGDASVTRVRAKGGIQFGASGPVASYMTFSAVQKKGEEQGTEVELIMTPVQLYLSAPDLPPGKKWVVFEPDKGTKVTPVPGLILSSQTINPLDPAILKAILKGAKVKSVPGGHLYQGAVTYGDLFKAAPKHYAAQFGRDVAGEFAKRKVSWRLWTDKQGLVTRLMSNRLGGGADTRYSGWGQRMTIPLPPADEAMSWRELLDQPYDEPGFDLGPFRTSR
ncbi:hypothetical protein [Nonomuraea sp. NPDC003214]